jgi:hypothetical protein
MPKLPAFQFYPADWRKDPGVQSLTYHQRGVWFEMICLMHESPRRGVLLMPNGTTMTDDALSRILGLDKQNLTTTLTSILECGVADRDPESQALINRRMMRDEDLRQTRAECGKLGGNPNLVNQKVNQRVNQNPTTRVNQNPTPSSSSSSSDEDLSLPRENEVNEFASKQPGWSADVVKRWFLDRSSQGWVKGSGVPITNWKADLEAWIMREAQGNSPSRSNNGPRTRQNSKTASPQRTSKWDFKIPKYDELGNQIGFED